MSFQLPSHHSTSNKTGLERGRTLTTSEDTGHLQIWYSYLFDRGTRPSWMLFGCCIGLGLINTLSTLLILAEMTKLGFSDMLTGSNVLLLSTSFLVSSTWRFYSSHYQWEKEQNRPVNELSSRGKVCVVGSFLTVMLSPTVACLPLLAFCWFQRRGIFSSYTPGVLPLIISWVWINSIAVIPVPYLAQRRKILEQSDCSEGYALLQEGTEDYDTYENFDETDGPTFLPQHHPLTYYDIFGRPLNEETKATLAFTSNVSWKKVVGPAEALSELDHCAGSVPGEFLPPFVAPEVLAMAATSIGVRPDGMENRNRDTP